MSMLRNLSDAELLSELIGIRAAKRVYKGSITTLLCGTSPDAHVYMLHVAREVMERACLEELAHGVTLSAPLAVKAYLRTLFLQRKYEVFVCLFLDVKNRLILAEEMFRGTLTHTSVYPREIVCRALELNAAGIIFAHNHPSGTTEPSAADISLTQVLKTTLALVDVRVLDHMIVAGAGVYSFAEHGGM